MELESLFKLSSLLGRQADFDEIVRLVSVHSSRLLKADVVSITMINPTTQDTIKSILKQNKYSRRFEFAQTNIIGWVMNHETPFLSQEISSDDRFTAGLFTNSGIASAMCLPLISGGITIGYLVASSKKSGVFHNEHLDFFRKLSSICAPFLEAAPKIQGYFKSTLPDEALIEKFRTLGLIGKSQAFVDLLRSIEGAAQCDVRVLIEGNTGTGKELVAKSIHKLSLRSNGPFVAIDCGAIPSELLESEFFGHEKGAFSGATSARQGLFLAANEGTLFMDEIANLPLSMQAKLMRVLQEQEVRPVGSNKVRKVNIRIISASSSSLSELVEQGKFRADLYYRLLVYLVQVPDLVDRAPDIPLLASHFVRTFAIQQDKTCDSLQGKILAHIKQQDWPGNIRELQNFMERVVAMAPKGAKTIDLGMLPANLQKEIIKEQASEPSEISTLPDRLHQFEQQLIRGALIEANWNQSAAARILGIPEQTLRYKMDKLTITKP